MYYMYVLDTITSHGLFCVLGYDCKACSNGVICLGGQLESLGGAFVPLHPPGLNPGISCELSDHLHYWISVGCTSVEKLEGAFKVAKIFFQQAAQLPCMN